MYTAHKTLQKRKWRSRRVMVLAILGLLMSCMFPVSLFAQTSTSCSTIGANLVQNSSFEDPVIVNSVTKNRWQVYGYFAELGEYPYGTDKPIPGWNPTPKIYGYPYQVELQNGDLLFGSASKEGVQHAEIDNPGIVGFTQTIPTEFGKAYEIRFSYASRPEMTGSQKMGIYWNGKRIGSIDGTGDKETLLWQEKTFIVTAVDNTSILGFGALADSQGGGGNLIDVVSVKELSSDCQPPSRPNIYLPIAACDGTKPTLSIPIDPAENADTYMVYALDNTETNSWEKIGEFGPVDRTTYFSDPTPLTTGQARLYTVFAYNNNLPAASFHPLVDYDDFGQMHYGKIYSGWKIVPQCSFSITGKVFEDTNPKNQLADREERGYPNAQLFLDGPNIPPTEIFTNTAGSYSISNLAKGNYILQLILPSGYTNTTPRHQIITIDTRDVTAQNFGVEPLYSISGSIFNDENKNSKRDAGEGSYTGSVSSISIDGTMKRVIQTSTGSFTQLLPAGRYSVSYTSALPSGYSMVYPLNGPPPSFSVTIGPSCSTPTEGGARCTPQNNIEELNFAITSSRPWFQCVGGDCRIDSGSISGGVSSIGFSDPIPDTAIQACGGSNASIAGVNSNQPGIIFSGNGSANLGEGNASPSPYNWLVEGDIFDPPFFRTTFDYIDTTIRQSGITPINLANLSSCSDNGIILTCTIPPNITSGVYKVTNRTVVFNTSSLPVGKNIIVLVDGDMRINGTITVSVGSTAIFSVSGDIFVSKAVGASDPNNITDTTQHIQGYFSTDKSFIIEGNNDCQIGPDKRLNIGGSIVVNAAKSGGALVNQRDLCGNNKYCPVISIFARPDMMLYLPEFIKYRSDTWREVAP